MITLTDTNQIDHAVRRYVYSYFVDYEQPPTVAQTAVALAHSEVTISQAIQRLYDAHVLVLEPDSFTVRFAEPFCAVPTGFRVHTAEHAYWGTCAWDALGIPAALHTEAEIVTTCLDCDEALVLRVENGELQHNNEFIHFAVPAKQWWIDIFFT